jgi:hypothetical protein
MFAPLPVVVTSLLSLTIEVRPPPSDPYVLHTLLELCNLCITYFELAWLRVGSELPPF